MYGGLRPLGVGEILDNAIQVYRRNFRAFITMTAVAVVPIEIVTVLVNLSARPSSHTQESTIGGIQFGSSSTGHEEAVRLGASFVVIILAMIAGRLAIGACTRGVADAYLGGVKADARASLLVAFRSLGSLLWLELLAAPAIGVGLLFCLAPGVWLWVSWIVATPVLLVEGVRGTHALRRSFQLVNGRRWPILGLALIAALLAGVVSTVLRLVLVGVILATRDATSTAYIVSSGVIGAVSSLLTTPLVASAYVILYFDLRVRREGLDMQIVLNNLDSPATPNITPPWSPAPPTPPAWGAPPPPPPPRL
jgi:hypothetical protein